MNYSKAENNKRVKQQPQQDNTWSEGQSIIQERGLGSETGDGNKNWEHEQDNNDNNFP